MSAGWIKMRAALLQSPKLIAVARILHSNAEFREWLTPGGGGPMNGQIVSDDALRCVTSALLLRMWSSSRDHGKFEGDDLILPHITIDDLDLMAGVGGFGEALETVGWAVRGDKGIGVTLPNFKEYNVPIEAKERQKAYRERQSKRDGALRNPRNENPKNVAPRVEKSREDKEEPKGSSKSQPESATRRLAFSEWDAAFAQRMHADILAVVPSAKEPSFDAWANDLRLIREQDRRSEAEIEALWSWANSDSFWRSVLLSPRKLREKWTQLEAKRSSQSRAGPKHGRDLMRGHRDFEAMLEKANGSQAVQQPDDGTGNGNRPRLLG